MSSPPPEFDIGQDDEKPDLDLLLIVVLRLLNDILTGGQVEVDRVRAIRNAVRRYRRAEQ